jgi:hypothetical protein
LYRMVLHQILNYSHDPLQGVAPNFLTGADSFNRVSGGR